MQTIISKVGRFAKKNNLVFIASDVRSLDAKYFSNDELKYIKSKNKENKQEIFAFNHFSQWTFVHILEKERIKNQRMENYRRGGNKLLSKLNGNKLHGITIIDTEDKPKEILAYAEGLSLGNYQFLKFKKDPGKKFNSLNSIFLLSKNITKNEIDELNIVLDATNICRNLVNEPVISLNAEKLALEIENLGKESGAKVETLNKKKIEVLKMGGLLAVNFGSIDPPTFSIMEWKPKNAINNKPYVFVGKGVVYDTGGMNLKTGNFMNNMKMDMAGGATVASAVYAIAKAKLPVYIIGLVPATDNRTNGNAYVSGDVITMYDGTRVEVLNTDAEGRMILADALSYAKKYTPEMVIDLATLTGAAARAIGKYGIVGMNSGADKEFSLLQKSGEEMYERIVEFPFWKEYEEEIKSDVGDIKNLGGAEGGAITAGKFLEHFTDYPYVHLDIAGPAYVESSYQYYPIGATGMGVRLLFNFIKNKV